MSLKPSEVRIWEAYRFKHGPMSPVRMYDLGPAIIAAQVNNAHGGKAKPSDFMPYAEKKDEDILVDTEQFVQLLQRTGKARVKNG